jgi:hypothetical protein
VTDYCTVADVRLSLNIGGNADDTLIGRIVASASEWVDRHCALAAGSFKAAETTRYYDWPSINPDGSLRVDIPLLALTELKNGDGSVIPNNSTSLILYPLNGEHKWNIHLLQQTFAVQPGGFIAVKGKFGWSAAVPQPILEATIMLACWMYKRYQAALQDSTVNQELGSVIYGEAMPKQVRDLLRPFHLGQGKL